MRKLSRRTFLKGAALALPASVMAEATVLEPHRVSVKHFRIGDRPNPQRIAQITDIHYKGDRKYLEKVMTQVNELRPDCVCFTGDLVEEESFAKDALEILQTLHAPLFGIPGNHDYWARVNFADFRKAFTKQGGAFLMDGSVRWQGLEFWGVTGGKPPKWSFGDASKRILLSHYPLWVQKIPEVKFDLVLSGHSHGGQVRLPGVGSLLVPFNVGEFDLGMYQTLSGPMYVNPGIGVFYLNVRFCCPPEITLFEI